MSPLIRPLSSVLCPPEVGFPIRKFSDQSLFAAPQDLSQRTTSFIASQRQGIHQIPFRHLIVLMIREREGGAQKSEARNQKGDEFIPPPISDVRHLTSAIRISPIRKDQFCFKHIRGPCGQAKPTTEMLLPEDRGQRTENRRLDSSVFCHPSPVFRLDRMCFLFTMSDTG
jgi:hypothetical protein